MAHKNWRRSAKLLRCVSDPTRIGILEFLRDGEHCVCEIFEELEKDQTLISHHLKALRDCGLVKNKRHGKKIFYSLADRSVLEFLEAFDHLYTRTSKQVGKCRSC